VGEDQSRYVIVGGSAAGMAAAHAIRAKDPRGTITVLSEEPDAPYFRPLIPFLVAGQKQPGDMTLSGNGPYTGADIRVRTGARAAAIDPDARCVVMADGMRHGYQKILFATGSRPYVPSDIDGTDNDGVFALRTLADARRMAQRLNRTDHAVMLGGGLLNLKAAFALLARGVKVTLVVYSPEVLSQLMEPDDATLIRQALDNAGLAIMTGVAAVGVLADATGVTGVSLDNGRELPCQMVCIGKGVRPNVEFLEDSGVRVDGGIVADRYTGASLPGTYAAGDVAVTYEPVSGAPVMTALWTNAVEMGRCAGLNMAGIPTAYAGTFGILNATQVADEPFVVMGVVHTTGGGYEIHRKSTATTLRKLVFDATGSRLLGAVFVGDITNAGLYRYVIREKMEVTRFKRALIEHTLHYGHLMH
jgi:nitrite reductase (NADH) large subunit